jgi:hypothetical protein
MTIYILTPDGVTVVTSDDLTDIVTVAAHATSHGYTVVFHTGATV